MANAVFISYSSKDKPIADAICTSLEVIGIRCWIAPRDIAPGEDWPTAIAKAIANSCVMVLVFSASSNSSDEVSREIILAAKSKLVIIPFKIEAVEPEPGKDYYLARTHWLDAINPPLQGQINILIERVKVLVPSQATPHPILPQVSPLPMEPSDQKKPGSQPPGLERPPRKRRFGLWPLWLAMALVTVGLITWIGFGGVITSKFKAAVPTRTYMNLGVLTLAGTKSTSVDISGITGTWSGTTVNGDFQTQITITVFSSCAVDQVCAHFDNPTLSCSGDFSYVQLTNGMFEFKAVNKQGSCGVARDFLQAQPDGTLLYLSQGDFGENRGYLQKTSGQLR